jgi:hypothetical protein
MMTAGSTWLSTDPAGRHREMEPPADTRLPVLAHAGAMVLVATPDRGGRWLPARDVRIYGKARSMEAADAGELKDRR